jgi:hypothetical protein
MAPHKNVGLEQFRTVSPWQAAYLSLKTNAKEGTLRMTKAFATAIAAATLLAASPGNAQDSRSVRQDLRLAQGLDIQVGRDRDDGYRLRRYDSDATVGIGPGGHNSASISASVLWRQSSTPPSGR